MFVKNILKDENKNKKKGKKRIRIYVAKCNLYLYILIQQILPISGEKVLMSADVKGCVTWFKYFSDLL